MDIGSGSSPVPTFLYQRRRAKTYATETDRKYLDRQKSYMETLGLGKRDSFVAQREDATRLSFADGSVDFVTAISTIEHIPGDGDVRVHGRICARPASRRAVGGDRSNCGQLHRKSNLRFTMPASNAATMPQRCKLACFVRS